MPKTNKILRDCPSKISHMEFACQYNRHMWKILLVNATVQGVCSYWFDSTAVQCPHASTHFLHLPFHLFFFIPSPHTSGQVRVMNYSIKSVKRTALNIYIYYILYFTIWHFFNKYNSHNVFLIHLKNTHWKFWLKKGKLSFLWNAVSYEKKEKKTQTVGLTYAKHIINYHHIDLTLNLFERALYFGSNTSFTQFIILDQKRMGSLFCCSFVHTMHPSLHFGRKILTVCADL